MNSGLLPFFMAAPAPPVPSLFSFQLAAATINAQAAGRFGGLTESFTHDGQSYTITYLFTHPNGVQFRFADNAQALAFIAANFLIDLGIAGQQPFVSSLMENDSARFWAQYRAYAGRFVSGTTYTITIREGPPRQIDRLLIGATDKLLIDADDFLEIGA